MPRITCPAGNSPSAWRFAPLAWRGRGGAAVLVVYGAALPVSARAVVVLAPAGSGALAEARRRLHGDRRLSGAPRLPPGSVSNGPGRPPALVPGPGRAGTSFHPQFPLRDSVSRCEKTSGSTLPSLPRYVGVRAGRTPTPRRDSTSRCGKTRRHRVRFAFARCRPPPPPPPPRRQSLAPTPGNRGPAGALGTGSAYGRHTASRSLCPAAPGSLCLGRKPRA